MKSLVSVVVRSHRRPQVLLQLIERLRRQRYEPFEIVVVEQSQDPRLVARLEALNDSRLRLIVCPPLGAPGARNEGVRKSRGEILAFIDDDDLPIAETWIADHAANYTDPLCMGVNGRLSPRDEVPPPPRYPRLVRSLSFHYSLFRDPRGLPIGSLRKPGILFAVGNNFSVRRRLVERVGGWDEGIPMGEEQSFFFRYERARAPGEYLVYDPLPVIWRRVDLAGGLDRRTRADWFENELKGRVIYYHHVVRHYFPWRFWLLYPLFVLRPAERVLIWIWDADNRFHGFAPRLRASLSVFPTLPRVTWQWGLRWNHHQEVRRVLALP